jgi:hypothetical protein
LGNFEVKNTTLLHYVPNIIADMPVQKNFFFFLQLLRSYTRGAIYEPAIIVATDTWLNEEYTENELTVDGYILHRRDRNKHGGGIMIGIKRGITGTVLWSEESVEMMGLKVCVGSTIFQLIALYRPPCDGDILLRRLRGRVTEIGFEENLILAGDINLPNVRWCPGTERGGFLQEIISDILNEGLSQVVNEGTRISKTGINNTLDIALVRPEEMWLRTEIIDGISDHKIPIIHLAISPVNQQNSEKIIWNYKKTVKCDLKQAFSDHFCQWNTIDNDDVDNMWTSFKNICEEIQDTYVPHKILKGNADPSYYDKNVKKLKQRCRKLYNQKKRITGLEGKLGLLRIALDEAKLTAKNKFMARMFNEKDFQGSWNKMYKFVGSQKGNCKILPTLIDSEGNEWDDDYEKAMALNRQYINVFNTNDNCGYINEGNESEILIISDIEIVRVIRKLKNGTAPGHDNISNDFIKLSSDYIINYLLKLFNSSLRTGKVPQDWKDAVVIPIFKGGERSRVINYRPISLTSLVSKIMERVIKFKLLDHLKRKNKTISDLQHGFKKGHSCETQLLGFESELTEILDKGGKLHAVFIDFEKAFDKVDHKLLLEKLWIFTENKSLTNWIGDFLNKRSQKVMVGKTLSEKAQVTSGVPQGTVLGPLLFNIFIDDIKENISSKLRLYADDCVVYRQIKNEVDVQLLQEDLNNIAKWVKHNKMGLNIKKCKVIKFGSRIDDMEQKYKIGENTLENVNTYKYLGIIFKKDLSWREHIEKISNKGIKALNFIMRQIYGTNKEIKEKAYLTLIRPIIEYASSVWDPHKKIEIMNIEKVQRLAARRVLGRMKRWKILKNSEGQIIEEKLHERPTLMVKELGWCTLEARRKDQRILNYYRTFLGNDGWQELSKKITHVSLGNIKRNTHGNKVYIKTSKTDIGKFSFLNRTGIDWNTINEKIIINTEEMNIKSFKKNYMEWMIEERKYLIKNNSNQ